MQFSKDSEADVTPRICTSEAYPVKIGYEYRLYFDFKQHQAYGTGGKFEVKVQTANEWAPAVNTELIDAKVATTAPRYGTWIRMYCRGGSGLTWETAYTFTATASPVYVLFGGTWPAGTGVAVSIDNVVFEPAGTTWTAESDVATTWANEAAVTTTCTNETAIATEWVAG